MLRYFLKPNSPKNGSAPKGDPAAKIDDIWQLHFIQLVLLTTLLRLIFAVFAEVKYEEAYYWCYAVHLDLSYFDHPPMVGWLIHLFSSLGSGQAEMLVRIPAILLFAATLTILFRLTKSMFSSKTAFFASAIACCLPAFEWYSMFMLPDAPLLFCWALGTMYGYKLVTENKTGYWWVIGLATGLGLLSKYPAALIPLAPILYLSFQKRWKTIFNLNFLGAIVVALALFSPVIIWNAQHEWCSFLFQATSRWTERHTTGFVQKVGGTLLNQVLILSPGGLILVIWALIVSWKRRQEQQINYLLCAALPFLAIVMAVSCIRLVQMNWPLPAYFASIIIIASEIERRELFIRRKIVMALVFLPALLISFLPLLGALFPISSLNRANDIKGWQEVARTVMRDMAIMPDPDHTFIAGVNYQLSSELAFYTGRPDIVHCAEMWGTHSKGFTYWNDDNVKALRRGWDAIIVSYEELRSNGEWVMRGDFYEQDCRRSFEEFAKCENFTVFYGGKPLRRYRIYLGRNYLGPQDNLDSQKALAPQQALDTSKTNEVK